MKVYVSGTGSRFEQQVAQTLDRLDSIDGCALVGFTYNSSRRQGLQEIDVVVVSRSGLICCLEVKGYTGTWIGSINGEWTADGKTIESSPSNPYRQVQKYALRIKDTFCEKLRPDVDPWVNTLIVAPDQTQIQISDAYINQMGWGKAINICQLSHLGTVLATLIEQQQHNFRSQRIREQLQQLGLESALAQLVNLSEQEFLDLRFFSKPQPQQVLDLAPLQKQRVAPAPVVVDHPARNRRQRSRSLWPLAAAFLMGAIGLGGVLRMQGYSLADISIGSLSVSQPTTPSLSGVINGWSMITSDQVELSLNADDGQIYYLYLGLDVMGQIPHCSNPGSCNHRQVEIRDVALQPGSNRLEILNSDQMVVL